MQVLLPKVSDQDGNPSLNGGLPNSINTSSPMGGTGVVDRTAGNGNSCNSSSEEEPISFSIIWNGNSFSASEVPGGRRSAGRGWRKVGLMGLCGHSRVAETGPLGSSTA